MDVNLADPIAGHGDTHRGALTWPARDLAHAAEQADALTHMEQTEVPGLRRRFTPLLARESLTVVGDDDLDVRLVLPEAESHLVRAGVALRVQERFDRRAVQRRLRVLAQRPDLAHVLLD